MSDLMLHTWKVHYIDRSGKMHEVVQICETEMEAMKTVRQSIPNIVVVGTVQVIKHEGV